MMINNINRLGFGDIRKAFIFTRNLKNVKKLMDLSDNPTDQPIMKKIYSDDLSGKAAVMLYDNPLDASWPNYEELEELIKLRSTEYEAPEHVKMSEVSMNPDVGPHWGIIE